ISVGDAFGLSRAVLRGIWLFALLALLAASSVFLVEGPQARVQDPNVWASIQPPPGGIQPQGLSLDGMAFLPGWYPGDYEALTWLNANITGAPTVVEAGYEIYYRDLYGRVAIFTGLPSVLAPAHEYEQRFVNQVSARHDEVDDFWGTGDQGAALAFLQRYG